MPEKRIQFQIKLLESNYEKIKIESKKLGITMSALVSMLIRDYKQTNIEYHPTTSTKTK